MRPEYFGALLGVLLFVVGLLLRIERRLTRVETRLEFMLHEVESVDHSGGIGHRTIVDIGDSEGHEYTN